jgi:hypothetical protein
MTQAQPSLLTQLYMQGKPLVEILIVPTQDQDICELITLINSLSPDIEVRESRYNHLISTGVAHPGSPLTLEGDATREALERMFGWRLVRVPLERWNSELKKYDGVCEDYFRWEALNQPQFYPANLVGKISSIGISSPGTNDNGNQDTVSYAV